MKCVSSLVYVAVSISGLLGCAHGTEVTDGEITNYIKHGSFSTKLAIYYQLAIEGNFSTEDIRPDIDGLLFQLGTTDDDEARQSLVDLIDVYVGEAHLNALLVAVTLHGDKILPMLKRKRSSSPVSTCQDPERLVDTPKLTWCLNEAQIRNRLDRLISYIEAGEKVEYIW